MFVIIIVLLIGLMCAKRRSRPFRPYIQQPAGGGMYNNGPGPMGPPNGPMEQPYGQTGPPPGGNYAPPSGPPPNGPYAPPSGPPPPEAQSGGLQYPGATHNASESAGKYQPPSGPPPGKNASYYSPPSGPPPS